MWRYLPGVKRPQSPLIPSKRTKSTSAPYSSDEEIDERHFVNSWKDNYPWIKYDDTNSKMYCITCKFKNFRQQLIVGTVKSLMFVSVNGPDPDKFDYLQPLEHWKKSRKHRHIYCSVSDKLV